MKPLILLLSLSLLLSACALASPVTTPMAIGGSTMAPTSTLTATLTPTKTPTPSPTPSPTITPTPTLEPISYDTARYLTEWQQIGNGNMESISWWPDKQTLTVNTGLSTFQYKADTLEALPSDQLPQIPGATDRPVFSSDGRMAAYILPLPNSYVIQLWNVTNNSSIKQIGNYKAVPFRMIFSPNARILAVQISLHQTDIWDVENGKLLWSLGGLPREPYFSMDGNIFIYCVFGGAYGSQILAIVLWNLNTGGSIYTIHPGNSGDLDLDISPDNTFLALHKIDEVVLINLLNGNYHRIMTHNLSKYGSSVVVKFSPDGKILAFINSEEGRLHLWDVQSGAEIKSIEGVGWVEKMLFTPDDKRLITAGDQIQLWDIDEGVRLSVVYGFSPVNDVFFIPDNKIILTYMNSFHEPMVWDINNRMLVPIDFPNGVPLAISPDGKLISYAVRDFEKKTERIVLYSLDNGEKVLQLGGEFKCDSDWGVALESTFSSDGNYLSIVCPTKSAVGNNIFVWNLKTGNYLELRHPEASAVFDPEGTLLISYNNRLMKFWDVRTGKLIHELYAPYEIRQVDFSPDHKILAAYSGLGIKFWELSTFKSLFQVSEPFEDYTFNQDWSKLAVVESTCTLGCRKEKHVLKVYDMSTQKVLYSIEGTSIENINYVLDPRLISSPDGKILVVNNFNSTSFDIIDFNSGAQLSSIPVPYFYTPFFKFSPDGRILAIPGYESPVRLYAIGRSSSP